MAENPTLDELYKKISELKKLNNIAGIDLTTEIKLLENKANELRYEIYKNLSVWERIKLARHLKRPTTLDYINAIFTDFIQLHGDRAYADDKAIIGGIAYFESFPVMLIGHQKGKDTKTNIYRNFAMAHPEGFRKAMRLMKLAENLSIPLITFIDTPGAYPGIGAEERGQFIAIAESIELMSSLKIPIIVLVIGEGGSGGALALGVGDRILILKNSYYSVISPEGCASILWRDGTKAALAAESLKIMPENLLELKVVDEVIEEPLEGAHTDYDFVFKKVKESFLKHLKELIKIDRNKLPELRYKKFKKMGFFEIKE